MLVRSRHLFALVCAAAAVACGGDSTGPTSYPPTLSQALAELTIPALSAGGPSLVDIDTPAASLDPTTCPYSAALLRFDCAPLTEGGITMKQNFTLRSASGEQQVAFDPGSTASVRTNSSVSGTVVEQGASLVVSGGQEITLSGLVSGPHVLDGYASITITGTVSDETVTYPVNMKVMTSIAKLVLPPNEAGSARVWPSSGTIYADVVGSFGPLSVNQRTVILFSGGSVASVGVSSGVQSKSCKVDLAVAQAVC